MLEPWRALLIGYPNTGKTTLFNALSGSQARTSNYPGTTVSTRRALLKTSDGRGLELIDVPGTYSLLPRSSDEGIAVTHVLGLNAQHRPDVVIVCVSAAELRSIYLAVELLEMGANVVVALTLSDEAHAQTPSSVKLSKQLQCPVVPLSARQGEGLDALQDAMMQALQEPNTAPRRQWPPSPALQKVIQQSRNHLPSTWPQHEGMALWQLMMTQATHADSDSKELVELIAPETQQALSQGLLALPHALDDEVIPARYRFIDRKLIPASATQRQDRSRQIDRIALHPWLGLPLFLLVMALLFQLLFNVADPAITAIESGFTWIGEILRAVLGTGLFSDFVVDGVIAGLGAVVVFVPQIALLFFFLGVLEESGYLARVAYLMDRVMKAMNLHGRAFVPMISGFACAVPAIMATRVMERKRDRLLTMMVVPLMSCSARLPIYTLIIAALFPAGQIFGVLPMRGSLMVAMYLFSTFMALLAAWILSRTMPPLKAPSLPFVIELPRYRMPQWWQITRMALQRAWLFIREAGMVIVVGSIVLWVLLSFPRQDTHKAPTDDAHTQATQLQHSYAGQLGRFIEPALAPLGFDWKMGIGIIGAFAAREVFVSTMAVVYAVGDSDDENSRALRDNPRAERHADGRPVYTPLVGLSLMIFFALACQCLSTLAVVKRETKSWRWPAFMWLYMTALAWLCSFGVYQVGFWLN